jgi:hypothetical protein
MLTIPREYIESAIAFFGIALFLYIFFVAQRVGRFGVRTLGDEVRNVGQGVWTTIIFLLLVIVALLVPFLQLYSPETLIGIKESRLVRDILYYARKVTPFSSW